MVGRHVLFPITSGLLTVAICCQPGDAAERVKRLEQKATAAEHLAGVIDRHFEAVWKKNQITPAPVAEDAELLRRLYLDLTGVIPRAADVRQFLADSDPAKRKKVVESLLERPRYASHFARAWQELLLPDTGDFQTIVYVRSLRAWLIGEFRRNTPFDELVQTLLTSDAATRYSGVGSLPYGPSPGAFYLAFRNQPEEAAAVTTRVFLGIRLECAQCHDHPFAKWTRNDFWQTAAFFQIIKKMPGRSGFRGAIGARTASVAEPNLPTVAIPGTKRRVSARFLDGKVPRWDRPQDPRMVLAKWITAPDNPYFARTTVNRYWEHFFGRGLIDPVDDDTAEDGADLHATLLDEMARQFVANGYDVKFLIRAITLSKTYQRSSRQTDPSQAEPRFFARAAVRGLTAEQLFDSLARAVGFVEKNDPRVRVPIFNNRSVRNRFINQFKSTDRPLEKSTSILQALAMMNGDFIADATSIENSRTLTAIIESPFLDNRQRIEALYLATVSRRPTSPEMQKMLRYVESGGATGDSAQALADVFWALLNSTEFNTNH